MNDIKYTTQSEKKLNCELQKSVNAYANGIIGTDTLVSLATKVGAECFPLTVSMYSQPTIVAKDLLAWSPKESLKPYKNSMLGSFTYPRATTPCSILVSSGVIVCANSCHAHIGKPESVIYRKSNGTFGIKRVMSVTELGEVKWAIGGMGLCGNYDPTAEGFTGAYADVLRKTNHNVLGVKNGMVYGIYFKNMDAKTIDLYCRTKYQFEMAILLDGGGLAAINGEEAFAQINVNAKQGYAIQFI